MPMIKMTMTMMTIKMPMTMMVMVVMTMTTLAKSAASVGEEPSITHREPHLPTHPHIIIFGRIEKKKCF